MRPGDLRERAGELSLLRAAGSPTMAGRPRPSRCATRRQPGAGGADPADAPATDQRGVARPQPAGTDPDIGAFELNQTAVVLSQVVGIDRDDFLWRRRRPGSGTVPTPRRPGQSTT